MSQDVGNSHHQQKKQSGRGSLSTFTLLLEGEHLKVDLIFLDPKWPLQRRLFLKTHNFQMILVHHILRHKRPVISFHLRTGTPKPPMKYDVVKFACRLTDSSVENRFSQTIWLHSTEPLWNGG